MPPKGKAAGKGRAPAKRKLAEEFPAGEILTDTAKKSWKLGAPVGQGGFGLIYLGERIFCSDTQCPNPEVTSICIACYPNDPYVGDNNGSEVTLFPVLSPADEDSSRSVGADARYVIKVVGRLIDLFTLKLLNICKTWKILSGHNIIISIHGSSLTPSKLFSCHNGNS